MDPFVAEIRIFGFNFAPKGWAFCNGQLLPIAQFTALFSLLGTNYGGDGKSTFGLPNFQASAPMHQGQGPSFSEHFLGETGGSDTIILLQSEIPNHTHALNADGGDVGEERMPVARAFTRTTGVGGALYGATASLVTMAPQALPPAGGDLPHNNLMPYLVLNFCIAMQGVFPQRP